MPDKYPPLPDEIMEAFQSIGHPRFNAETNRAWPNFVWETEQGAVVHATFINVTSSFVQPPDGTVQVRVNQTPQLTTRSWQHAALTILTILQGEDHETDDPPSA